MILKQYSAVAVVTKRVHIWLTDKLHTHIAVLVFYFVDIDYIQLNNIISS